MRQTEAVRLYHSTDNDGKRGIERDGFAVTHGKDYPGCSWFQPSRDRQVTSWRRDWWVIVDIPDEIVEPHRIVYAGGLLDEFNIPVPWDVVNRFRPFTFEPWDT